MATTTEYVPGVIPFIVSVSCKGSSVGFSVHSIFFSASSAIPNTMLSSQFSTPSPIRKLNSLDVPLSMYIVVASFTG